MSVYSRYDLPATRSPMDGHYNDHYKANKPNSEVKCQQRMLLKLLELKKQSLLRKAFILESNEFEVLEFYGDAFLYERVTKNILRSRRFMDPNLMTTLRRYCIKNDNLAAVFDQLGLEVLLDPPTSENLSLLTRKNKADIVEAIIGEIAEHHPEEDVLSELVAFISYVGEKEYFKEHNNHVMEPKNSSKSYKRIPRSEPHPRSHYNNNDTYHNQPMAQHQPQQQSNHSSHGSHPSPPKDPAPVFFLQNAKPAKNSHPPTMDNIKILKRGTDVNTLKPVVATNHFNNNHHHHQSENLMEAAASSVLLNNNNSGSPLKSTPSENVFFRMNSSTTSSQIPSWVPNIASTRNGMDLKT